MALRHSLARIVLLSLACSGCTAPTNEEEVHHVGPRVNLGHFITNTATYKGKAITLRLHVADPVLIRGPGPSLRDQVGRDVPFSATAPSGKTLNLLIALPESLAAPEVGKGDEVYVTFVCTRGDLRQGNVARAIELP
jgi:hypothetical protein